MFRLISTSLVLFGLFSSVGEAKELENNQQTGPLAPLVVLKIYREDGSFVASTYQVAPWANEVTEPHWESIEERVPTIASVMKSKGFEHYLRKFLDANSYWQLAKLGIWLRFPEKEHLTYYFLPYHRPAREVLAYFDTPENAGLRIDFLWDPRRIGKDGPGSVSSHVLRLYLSQLKKAILSDQESLLEVLDRLGAEIEASYSSEVTEGDKGLEPDQLRSHCVRLTREVGFRTKDS